MILTQCVALAFTTTISTVSLSHLPQSGWAVCLFQLNFA